MSFLGIIIEYKKDCGLYMDKVIRVLMLFHSLIQGQKINKADFAKNNNTSERSIDRDIKDIRYYLSEIHSTAKIFFDKDEKVYYLFGWENRRLSSIEVITILKVLIGSKVLRKDEMQEIMRSIRMLLDPTERRETVNSVYREVDNYISPAHGKSILKILEDLNLVISKRLKIELNYTKVNGDNITKRVLPLIFIFSDFYFYLIAFIDGTEYKYPAFFRVDRIKSFMVTNEHYSETLYEQYNAGEMRNCIQFMYAGELMNVKVRCKNQAVEAFKDRLANNWLIKDEGEYKVYGARVFGEGFVRWALLQGNNIEILEPKSLREKFLKEISNILALYK